MSNTVKIQDFSHIFPLLNREEITRETIVYVENENAMITGTDNNKTKLCSGPASPVHISMCEQYVMQNLNIKE